MRPRFLRVSLPTRAADRRERGSRVRPAAGARPKSSRHRSFRLVPRAPVLFDARPEPLSILRVEPPTELERGVPLGGSHWGESDEQRRGIEMWIEPRFFPERGLQQVQVVGGAEVFGKAVELVRERV